MVCKNLIYTPFKIKLTFYLFGYKLRLQFFAIERCFYGTGDFIHIGNQRIRLARGVILTERNKIHIFPSQKCGNIFGT